MVATAPAGRPVQDTEAVSARTTLGVFLRQADRFVGFAAVCNWAV